MSVEQRYRPGQDYLKAPTIALPNNREDITHDVDETITVKKPVTPSIRTTTKTIVSIASPILKTPSIAVTSSSNDILAGDGNGTRKRSKIDFVRFDSVETIYKQLDLNEVVQRAKIKDEIHRYVIHLNLHFTYLVKFGRWMFINYGLRTDVIMNYNALLYDAVNTIFAFCIQNRIDEIELVSQRTHT